MTPSPDSREIIEALATRQPFGHPADDLRIIETHISWVLLAGPYAYKVKRPVDFGFLDYSTLARRRHFCELELALNRRTAPELYLEVVPITGSPEAPQLGGPGAPIEYAVKMVRFAEGDLLAERIEAGRLTPEVIDRLARELAAFHDGLPGCEGFGSPERAYAPMLENIDQLRELGYGGQPLDQVARWTADRFAALRPRLESRRKEGHIRECHGDLHLGNIVLYRGRPLPFDGIEFNDNLRFIDTASEIAFLIMDLDDHGRNDLANRFLNGYLEWSGDFGALPLLRFYQVYRAMVRAKVAALRAGQGDKDARSGLEAYLTLALRYTAPVRPFLLVTCGVSGSGKSTVAAAIAGAWGAIRLRSDIERKRLFGLAPDARSESGVGAGIYLPDATRRTYSRLAELAEGVLAAGYPVVVDATFLQRQERARFAAIAAGAGVPFAIVLTDADPAVLQARVEARARTASDPSEATAAVLAKQLDTREPPGGDEPVLTVDTGAMLDTADLVHRLQERLRLAP